MTTEILNFQSLPRLPISIGSATPNPGTPGVIAWSTTENQVVIWGGVSWSALGGGGGSDIGFDAGTWTAPRFTTQNSHMAEWIPGVGVSTVPGIKGFRPFTTMGTATARSIGSTPLERMSRVGYVSGAAAGSFAGVRTQSQLAIIEDGFFFTCAFGCSDSNTVSGARQFIGLIASAAAPTNNTTPSSNDYVGVWSASSGSNLSIRSRKTTEQVNIDLGVDFPSDPSLKLGYLLVLYAPKDTSSFSLGWFIQRVGSSISASGTLSAAEAPDPTLKLAPYAWRCNNTHTLDVALDISSITLAVPYL